MIPISLPQLFFQRLHKLFLVLICQDAHPQLARSILRKWKDDGGLGLPNINLYYKAMALVCILNWHHNFADKLWVPLEKTLAGRNLAEAPWVPSTARGL